MRNRVQIKVKPTKEKKDVEGLTQLISETPGHHDGVVFLDPERRDEINETVQVIRKMLTSLSSPVEVGR